MKNTFNYTGRKKILRENVAISIRRPNQLPEAGVDKLSLDDFRLPPDAAIFLEVDTGRVGLTRYQLGTVSQIDFSQNFPLSEMELSDVTFRIKVVGQSGSDKGKILADVDHLRPTDGGKASSLLEVRPSDDLGQRIWKLDVSPDGPQLLINAGLPDWRDYGSSTTFQSLVFPQAIYEICLWLRLYNEYAEGTIEGRWRALLKSEGYDPSELDQIEDFENRDDYESYRNDRAQEVADAFARKHKTLESLTIALEINNE